MRGMPLPIVIDPEVIHISPTVEGGFPNLLRVSGLTHNDCSLSHLTDSAINASDFFCCSAMTFSAPNTGYTRDAWTYNKLAYKKKLSMLTQHAHTHARTHAHTRTRTHTHRQCFFVFLFFVVVVVFYEHLHCL